jgi:EAL domain-containing protein (putative c-di-GMP-specific phosphodiesterase class I)
VQASLGIVVSDGTEDAGALLRNADLAMYRAKSAGKGRFEVYEAGMHAAVVERMALKADLRRGIAAGEFRPHYQPIVDLETGSMTGVEALARWLHPARGVLAPSHFIPVAEETGMIVEIGWSILDQACVDARRWKEDFEARAPRSVSVNLSPRQLREDDLVARVAGILSQNGLPPHMLTLEVTETALLDDTDAIAEKLAALKAFGVGIALDDFGTGYSSLSHLDRFPVDIVKIDKSFIDSLAGPDATPSPLVDAIVRLGAVLDVEVTAEGIESGDQLARLRVLGCGHGQGYFFARPVAEGDLREMLTSGALQPTAPA